MRIRSAFVILAAFSSLGLAGRNSIHAAEFTVDPVHSTMVFRVKHKGVAYFYGRFTGLSGKLSWDESNPSACSVEFEVASDSVDTASQKRDQHLKSPDFFNVKQFPTISFKSKSVKKTGDVYEITGDFTLHGVTKKLTIKAELVGQTTGRRGPLIGFEINFTLKRSDFGMTNMLGDSGISDEVKIMMGVEANGRR